MKTERPPPNSDVARFRLKMVITLMLVVGAVTGGGIYYVERSSEAADQTRLRNEFEGELGRRLGSQEARRAAIAERCQILARSPRVLAALDEGELEDLYLNAEVELRDVLENEWDKLDDGFPRLLQARGFRFLNASGQLMPRPTEGRDEEIAPWETQLALGKIPKGQETGYIVLKSDDGQDIVNEVIVTPIVDRARGETLGAVALYFMPVDLRPQDSQAGLKVGILLKGRLFVSSHAKGDEAFASDEVVEALSKDDDGDVDSGNTVMVRDEPYIAFSNIINPDSSFPAAQQVCFYPIAESLARKREKQWEVATAGGITLLIGLLLSYLISIRLSKPVEQLAVDSAANLAERAKAEAALQVTERKYQSIFENAIEGIFVLSEEGKLRSVNPAFATICGFASPAGMLAAWEDAAPIYGGTESLREFLARVREAGAFSEYEVEMDRADGNRIWVSQNVRCVPSEDGAQFHFEGSMEDITGRKHAADELKKLNAGLKSALHELKATQHQVIQQERMRALGEMASGVAHDFNNALTPILGFTELLMARAVELKQTDALDHLKTIRVAATDAASVVSRLREFYRTTSSGGDVFRAVDLNEVIRQTVTLTQPRWRQQAQSNGVMIEINLQLEASLAPVSGEASALREMLTNLIFNAVDAMPSGGKITLSTHRERDRSVIKVSDAGTGMSEEVRQHCLEPFFSTKGDRGTGLGLSMVFGIIQKHQGTLEIESRLGEGTTLVISLPITEAPENSVPALAEKDSSAGPRPLRLLVVDDEQPIRMLLSALLKRDGHNVVTATEGNNALQLFHQQPFDLIITDKAMPEMNGDQLAKAVKKVSPQMPVILLTGFGEFIDRTTLPEVDVLASKPFSIETLREAIAVATTKKAA